MSSVLTGVSSRPRSGRVLRVLSDERLIARIRAGDERAFEAVYDRYSATLLSFCRHMLGDPDEAEDAVQHTCISAYRALLADEREIQLKAWLFAIARNRCFSILRARREHADLEDHEPSTAGLGRAVELREDLRALLGDLRGLPDDQRAALVLMEIGAHSHDEIAVILDVRKEKVKALVFQAREHLQARRNARETDCSEIREELAAARGSGMRRGHLRHHLAVCGGCSEFADEVRRQRAAIGMLLPVVPGAALKASIFGSLFGGGGAAGGGAAAAGLGSGGDGAAAAAAGLGALGTGGGLFALVSAQGATVKALAVIVAAGSVGGTGYVAIEDDGDSGERRAPHVASVTPIVPVDHGTPAAVPTAALGPSGTMPAGSAAAAGPSGPWATTPSRRHVGVAGPSLSVPPGFAIAFGPEATPPGLAGGMPPGVPAFVAGDERDDEHWRGRGRGHDDHGRDDDDHGRDDDDRGERRGGRDHDGRGDRGDGPRGGRKGDRDRDDRRGGGHGHGARDDDRPARGPGPAPSPSIAPPAPAPPPPPPARGNRGDGARGGGQHHGGGRAKSDRGGRSGGPRGPGRSNGGGDGAGKASGGGKSSQPRKAPDPGKGERDRDGAGPPAAPAGAGHGGDERGDDREDRGEGRGGGDGPRGGGEGGKDR